MGFPIKIIGEVIKFAGTVLGGHKPAGERVVTMTNAGVAVAVASATALGVTSGNPFESIRVVLDGVSQIVTIVENDWASVVAVFGMVAGAVTTVAGFFRRAGRKTALPSTDS